jgi:hypothetical protein
MTRYIIENRIGVQVFNHVSFETFEDAVDFICYLSSAEAYRNQEFFVGKEEL